MYGTARNYKIGEGSNAEIDLALSGLEDEEQRIDSLSSSNQKHGKSGFWKAIIVASLMMFCVILYSNGSGSSASSWLVGEQIKEQSLAMVQGGKMQDRENKHNVSGRGGHYNLFEDQLYEMTGSDIFDREGDENLWFLGTHESIRSELVELGASWYSALSATEVPSIEGAKESWAKAQGLVPWMEDTNTPHPAIEQKFSHSSAPNIIFFLVDDWGHNDPGYQSSVWPALTPNINKLAGEGVILTNYFSHEKCSPSRSAFLTGRYSVRTGLHGSDGELPSSEYLIGEELRSAGYATHMIGKWHMGYSSWAKTPLYRGFDTFFGYYDGWMDYWTKAVGKDADIVDLHDDSDLVNDRTKLATDMWSPWLWSSRAEQVIEKHAARTDGKPMFMYFSSQLIHVPYQVPEIYLAQCRSHLGAGSDDETADLRNLVYACAMNIALDETLGNLTCALERNGMADNTVIVVASDNGGDSGRVFSNYPMRGQKGSTFTGGHKVAGFVHSPLIPESRRGSKYGGMMHVTDWMPTFMGLATNSKWTSGIINQELDGVDQWSCITGEREESPRTEIIHYYDHNGAFCVQKGNFKLLHGFSSQAIFEPTFTFDSVVDTKAECSLV